MAKDQRDILGALSPAGVPEYTVTNRTVDRVLDANEEAGALLVADVLATLIEDLIAQGILKGSVS